jgi:transcriptional regulator with XRE-family HTH domain
LSKPDVVSFGRRLTQLRELRGLSLSATAAAAGIAKSYLLKLERGEVENPGLKTLDAIARALGTTLAELLAPSSAEPGLTHPTSDPAIAEFEQLVASLPPELKEFLAQMEREEEKLPADVVRSLASIQFRGKRPRSAADWRFIYEALNRTI